MSAICSIAVSAPPRNLGSGPSAVFTPAEAVVTWSWGLQPATALIDWVSAAAQPAIVFGSTVAISLGGHVFYGVVDNLVSRVASDGFSVMQEFRDNREFLMWDMVYAAFNLHDARVVNGAYQTRYRHLLPGDFNANAWSFTDTPYTAAQILDFLFGAATVETAWARQYHSLMANPVYDLDYTSGQKLGQALVDVSERLGLVFTLLGGPYQLVWALKGAGILPGFPSGSDNRRLGAALSGNPNRVRVLGDRNRYQIFNVALGPDWLPAWEAFWDFGAFVDDLFLHESTEGPVGAVAAGVPYKSISGDVDHVIGYMLASARARLLTVGQYADLRDVRSGDGESFRDYRRFQGRSRLGLPVALYLGQLLFRAFRVPDGFGFYGANGDWINRFGFDLDSRPVVEMTHDPVSGWIEPMTDGYGHYEVPSSEHNGYAVVQGYQVAQDAFASLNPAYFDYASWISAQELWQYAPFQIDDSGEGSQFVIFDQPVINSGTILQAAANLQANGKQLAVMSASPTFNIPAVMAAVTVVGERFSWVQGNGRRDDVENISGLAGEFLILQPGQTPIEQPFADGLTASQKAAAYAAARLNGQLYYQNGGYQYQGVDGQGLSATVDRITLRWNARDGIVTDVDFTNERSRNVAVNGHGTAVLQLEPERAFDRRSQLEPLFPGQEQLRQESRQLQLSAAILRTSPSLRQTLVDTFHSLMGLDSPPQSALFVGKVGGSSPAGVPVGTPLFREATANNVVWADGTATITAPVFIGVTVMDGELNNGGVRYTAMGCGGVVQVLLALAATDAPPAGSLVGCPQGNVAPAALTLRPKLVVGTLVDGWSSNAAARTVLTRVKLNPNAVVGMNLKGEYDPTLAYGLGDVVFISTGANAGTYVCITSVGTLNQAPWLGNNYWAQCPMGASTGVYT